MNLIHISIKWKRENNWKMFDLDLYSYINNLIQPYSLFSLFRCNQIPHWGNQFKFLMYSTEFILDRLIYGPNTTVLFFSKISWLNEILGRWRGFTCVGPFFPELIFLLTNGLVLWYNGSWYYGIMVALLMPVYLFIDRYRFSR